MQVISPTINEWREFVEGLPNYSFFQLPIWAETFEKTYPDCKIATKLFTFDDGIEVLVPLVETSYKLGFKSFESLPGGGYGGFLWNKRPSEAQLKQLLKHILNKKVLSLAIFPNPLDWESLQFLEDNGFECKKAFTHILKLDKHEVLWGNLTHACKKNIKQAQRENLKLVEGQLDDLGPSYYEMYRDSAKRWDMEEKGMIPLEFFQKLMQVDGEKIKLFFVEKEGRKIAGVIMGYGKGESFQWHAVSFYQYENLRPTNFWEWEVIRDAYEKGYEIHNFGASIGLPGVQRFKESFGAEKLDYKYFIYESPLLKAYRKIKTALRFTKRSKT